MSHVRASWRLLRLTGHIVSGLWRVRRLSRLEPKQASELVREWHAGLLRVLAVEVETIGHLADEPGLHLPNHISWLDIPLLGAHLHNSVFLSKDEVRSWPVVGSLAAASGTLFVRRGGADEATRAALRGALEGDRRLVLFAEGTTTCGDDVRRFHGRLLQAAIDTERPIHPVLLRYRLDDGAPDYGPAYVGDDSLMQSLWQVLRAKRTRAELHWLPVLSPESGSRNDLARAAETAVRTALKFSINGSGNGARSTGA